MTDLFTSYWSCVLCGTTEKTGVCSNKDGLPLYLNMVMCKNCKAGLKENPAFEPVTELDLEVREICRE